MVPIPICIYYACIAAAHLAWVRRDWDSLLAELEPLQEPLAAGGHVAGLGQRVRRLLEAEAMVGTGRLDDAARELDKVDAAMDESPHDVTRVEFWRLRGALEHARERPATARAAFIQGQAAAQTANSPLAEGLLELAYGHFLRKTGSRRAATARLQVARELFDRLRSRPFLERCDAELAACGVRPQADADDDYGLTAREQVVASLVTSGKSNREVGAELYVSAKAIEYHLANIFSKLGIRSRHQLASRLTRPPSRDMSRASENARGDSLST
jgi:ATP/maltotriose-dependent transcriptional regulator MalT